MSLPLKSVLIWMPVLIWKFPGLFLKSWFVVVVFSGVVTETSGVRGLQQQVVQVSGPSDSGGTAAEPSQGQETSTEVQNSINHACAGSFVS